MFIVLPEVGVPPGLAKGHGHIFSLTFGYVLIGGPLLHLRQGALTFRDLRVPRDLVTPRDLS